MQEEKEKERPFLGGIKQLIWMVASYVPQHVYVLSWLDTDQNDIGGIKTYRTEREAYVKGIQRILRDIRKNDDVDDLSANDQWKLHIEKGQASDSVRNILNRFQDDLRTLAYERKENDGTNQVTDADTDADTDANAKTNLNEYTDTDDDDDTHDCNDNGEYDLWRQFRKTLMSDVVPLSDVQLWFQLLNIRWCSDNEKVYDVREERVRHSSRSKNRNHR